MNRRRRIALLAACVVIGFLLYEFGSRVVAYTDDAFVRADLVAVAPQVEGRVVKLHVIDGQAVKPGALLLTIDPEPFQLVLDERRAALAEASALDASDADAIAAAVATHDAAVASAQLARQTLDRVANLVSRGDVSRQQSDDAQAAIRRADAEVMRTKALIDQAAEMRVTHAAATARAAAMLRTAEWRLAQTRLLAPVGGIVNNLLVHEGDTVALGTPAVGILDTATWRIVANYHQGVAASVEKGKTAWVWLGTQPWHFHRAQVSRVTRAISRAPEEGMLLPYVAPTTDWIRLERRFPVTVTLVDPPADLPLLMGADARMVIFFPGSPR
jgi:multidrug efflux system membrane fusion protein